jgi:hypothetical protein
MQISLSTRSCSVHQNRGPHSATTRIQASAAAAHGWCWLHSQSTAARAHARCQGTRKHVGSYAYHTSHTPKCRMSCAQNSQDPFMLVCLLCLTQVQNEHVITAGHSPLVPIIYCLPLSPCSHHLLSAISPFFPLSAVCHSAGSPFSLHSSAQKTHCERELISPMCGVFAYFFQESS